MTDLGLFEAYGIEMEYMIVSRDDLSVKPICDEVLREIAGTYVNEVEMGALRWSNELALHVIELKTNGPCASIDGALGSFSSGIADLDRRLRSFGAMPLPTAMHPTMDPNGAKLWPHDGKPIYNTYDRVFGTSGHGWVNLQSTHLNLPFADDEEFGRLHAAIRAVLPLLSGLAASSPIIDGRVGGSLDMRLEVYRTNQRRIPSIMGQIIPEPVWTEADYRQQILAPMYRDIAMLDPEGDLQDEWLNSRGAIARFDRNAIEIRLLDLQECPMADLAVCRLVSDTLRALCDERFVGLNELKTLPTASLAQQFVAGLVDADRTPVTFEPLLRVFGVRGTTATVGEIWHSLMSQLWDASATVSEPLRLAMSVILARGCLARRIVGATGLHPARGDVDDVYRELARCLVEGRMFLG